MSGLLLAKPKVEYGEGCNEQPLDVLAYRAVKYDALPVHGSYENVNMALCVQERTYAE